MDTRKYADRLMKIAKTVIKIRYLFVIIPLLTKEFPTTGTIDKLASKSTISHPVRPTMLPTRFFRYTMERRPNMANQARKIPINFISYSQRWWMRCEMDQIATAVRTKGIPIL